METFKDISTEVIQIGYSEFVKQLVTTVVPVMISKTYQGLKEKYKSNKNEIENHYENYLNNSLETVGYVKTIYNRNNPLKVESIFIPVDLSTNIAKHRYTADNIGSLLKISPPFVQINGVGGIGKTTTLKYLFVQVMYQKQFIPVYIELKRLNSLDEVPEIVDFIYENMSIFGFKMEKTDFRETLYSGKYVFLWTVLMKLS